MLAEGENENNDPHEGWLDKGVPMSCEQIKLPHLSQKIKKCYIEF